VKTPSNVEMQFIVFASHVRRFLPETLRAIVHAGEVRPPTHLRPVITILTKYNCTSTTNSTVSFPRDSLNKLDRFSHDELNAETQATRASFPQMA